MRLTDLVPPPYARAVPCAGPCPWCGSDGSPTLAYGAALARRVALAPGETLSRVGLWITVPDGTRALRVWLSGDALDRSLVAPTAVRLRGVDPERSGDDAVWSGAALTAVTHEGSRVLTATVRVPSGARVAVLDVAGFARDGGDGELVIRVARDAGGCLAQRVPVVVGARREGGVTGAYVAFEADPTAQCARVARWCDAVVAAMVRAGSLHGVATVRAGLTGRDALAGAVTVSTGGVQGDVWTRALRSLAAGNVAWIELCDARDDESAGLSIAPGTRAQPAPCELSAWAPAVDEGALWNAATHDAPGTLQALVGRWRDVVTPRVRTPWERERGAMGPVAERAVLGAVVRAPASRAALRGVVRAGDEVRAWWPHDAGGARERCG